VQLWPIRSRWVSSLLIVASVYFSAEVSAQTTTSGALTGVITDQTNAVVANANIEIRDITRGTTQSTKTDRTGVYHFFFLPPSRYTLAVFHDGFREERRTVEVLLGPPVTVNVALQIATANSEIRVADEAPLLKTEVGDVSTTVNQKQISELPNPGNDLTYVVQTAPGVVMNSDVQGGANFSILGMPGFSYLHTMDGMNDNDNAFNLSQVGALILLLGQNQIQEATVITTGYSGQFGGAAGGNINYITKSGGNQFHGNAQYYWNGRAFNANDWFNNAFGQSRPFSIANQWAASFGGPIKRNKLFFFFDTEGLRLIVPQHYLVTIPSAEFEKATMSHIDEKFGTESASHAFYEQIFNLYNDAPEKKPTLPGAAPTDALGCSGFSLPTTGLGVNVPCARYFSTIRSRPSQDALTSGRFDWNMNDNDRAFLRVQYDGGTGAIADSPISPAFDVNFTQPWWQAQLLETHSSSASAANQLLLAASYFAGIIHVKNPLLALAAFPTSLDFAMAPFNSLGGADYINIFGFGRYNTQYQISDDFARISGPHKLGAGLTLSRTYWSELPRTSGNIGHLSVQTVDAFYQGGVDPASPSTDFSALSQSFTSQRNLPISFLNFSFYADDNWRARPNLAFTLALRAEHYSNPVCRNRCFARLAGPFQSISHDPDQPYDQAIAIKQKSAFASTERILWSPRISFAWQPRGVPQNAVFRGGIGIFYDPLPGLILDSFSGNPPLLNSYTVVGNNIAPGEATSLFKDAAVSNAAFVNGFALGQTLAQIQAADPTFFPPAITGPDKRTHSPQFQRWSLEWQQTFGTNTSIGIGYFGHHGIHGLVMDPDANAFGFGSLPPGKCSGPPMPACAPDPRFGMVTQIKTNNVSNYHGTVVSLQHRFTRWTEGVFQANYTFGHALDEVSSNGWFIFTSSTMTAPQDPGNLRGSYGSADQDVRHSFNANYVWDVPVKAALRRVRPHWLVHGWQISGTMFARSGFPYTVIDPAQSGNLVSNNYFGGIYAVLAGPLSPGPACGEGAAIPLAANPCQPPQVLNDGTLNPKARFVQPTCETGFDVGRLPSSTDPCGGGMVALAQGRNRFRGPGYFSTDFTIMKNTKLPGWENAKLGFGLQFFNLFNHPNFGFPDADLSSPIFGQIAGLEQPPTGILGSGFGGDAAPRMIQLKAVLQF
jgi:Carboxypeptidase regulatory-like domain